MMKQIIAMGGGGFSMEPDNLSLDQYILNQSKREQPRICFLPTASGDSQNYIQRFYHAFQTLDCVPSHLSLFKPPSSDLASFVMEMDVIYVGGGNTRNLLVMERVGAGPYSQGSMEERCGCSWNKCRCDLLV
ncbi:Peptidase E [Bacillus subtilis]|nr:Peptidase E [Bacillus subtilis]